MRLSNFPVIRNFSVCKVFPIRMAKRLSEGWHAGVQMVWGKSQANKIQKWKHTISVSNVRAAVAAYGCVISHKLGFSLHTIQFSTRYREKSYDEMIVALRCWDSVPNYHMRKDILYKILFFISDIRTQQTHPIFFWWWKIQLFFRLHYRVYCFLLVLLSYRCSSHRIDFGVWLYFPIFFCKMFSGESHKLKSSFWRKNEFSWGTEIGVVKSNETYLVHMKMIVNGQLVNIRKKTCKFSTCRTSVLCFLFISR